MNRLNKLFGWGKPFVTHLHRDKAIYSMQEKKPEVYSALVQQLQENKAAMAAMKADCPLSKEDAGSLRKVSDQVS